MSKENITSEVATLSREFGYDPFTPLNKGFLHSVRDWLREEHCIDVIIVPGRYSGAVNYLVRAEKFDLSREKDFIVKGTNWFNDNHEYPEFIDALEKGVLEGLKLLKEELNGQASW